jgi:cytochrome c biogenesis protein ResB
MAVTIIDTNNNTIPVSQVVVGNYIRYVDDDKNIDSFYFVCEIQNTTEDGIYCLELTTFQFELFSEVFPENTEEVYRFNRVEFAPRMVLPVEPVKPADLVAGAFCILNDTVNILASGTKSQQSQEEVEADSNIYKTVTKKKMTFANINTGIVTLVDADSMENDTSLHLIGFEHTMIDLYLS